MVYLVKKKGRTLSRHRLKKRAIESSKSKSGSYILKRSKLFSRDK